MELEDSGMQAPQSATTALSVYMDTLDEDLSDEIEAS